MKKIIFAGGPHTGKTSLIQALCKHLPEVCVVPEPATELIHDQLKREQFTPSFQGVYPWNHYPQFVLMALAKSIQLESEIPQEREVVLLDRSVVDNIAYARFFQYQSIIPIIQEQISYFGYDLVFFCDFVGEYTQTEERRETFEEAQDRHQRLLQAYEESGLPVIHLPASSIEERVERVLEEVMSK